MFLNILWRETDLVVTKMAVIRNYLQSRFFEFRGRLIRLRQFQFKSERCALRLEGNEVIGLPVLSKANVVLVIFEFVARRKRVDHL